MSKSKKLTALNTTAAVFAVFSHPTDDPSGTKTVAAITIRTYTAAFNWHAQHTFPSNTYIALQEALAERGYMAPPSLWGMTVAPKATEA
jgi:hypothetical protein